MVTECWNNKSNILVKVYMLLLTVSEAPLTVVTHAPYDPLVPKHPVAAAEPG
jgi:hypothetical protein